MNNKMTTTYNYQQMNLKEKKNNEKNTLSQQLEQEQNKRNGHHMEGFQWRGGGEEWAGRGTEKKQHNW